MKMKPIQVSEEYLDTICEWLNEWVKKKTSLTISQFLEEKRLGYPYLKYFCHISDKVNNTFEVVKSILHNRWFNYGMRQHKLAPHKIKMLMKYLRHYDGYGLDIETQVKQAVAQAEVEAQMIPYIENYANDELSGPYQSIYDENDSKRKDEDQA